MGKGLVLWRRRTGGRRRAAALLLAAVLAAGVWQSARLRALAWAAADKAALALAERAAPRLCGAAAGTGGGETSACAARWPPGPPTPPRTRALARAAGQRGRGLRAAGSRCG